MDVKQWKDPIYGYIDIPIKYVRDIIDTAAFQRLRRITQTSYSPLYASSIHNRFIHSLGVFHLGEIAVNTILGELQSKYSNIDSLISLEEVKATFLLACLLHDVGHAPFSHTGEKFYLNDLQSGKYTELHERLKNVVGDQIFSNDVPKEDSRSAAPHEIMSAIIGITTFDMFFPSSFNKEFFARCITGYKYSEVNERNSLLNCFISLLNSKVIDVDRLDYLIRDAFFTGFETINIDHKRLLTSLTIIKQPVNEDKQLMEYKLAYKKSAISVIENVVYAHDAERKWIQNHPVVLYEIYIMQNIILQIDKDTGTEEKRLFSVEALGETGISLKDNLKISLLCDDDIIYLIKNKHTDDLSKEYFSRRDRRHSLWKSEAEYKAYLLPKITGGEILDRIEKTFKAIERYVTMSYDSWTLDEKLMDKFNNEIKELESSDAIKISENSRQMQLNTKTDIMKVLTALKNYAQSKKETFDFVILSAAQFYSGFNKPDVSSINIVFKSRAEEKVVKIKDVIALLNGSERERDNFFYLYHKSSSGNMNKEEIFREIIKAFVC